MIYKVFSKKYASYMNSRCEKDLLIKIAMMSNIGQLKCLSTICKQSKVKSYEYHRLKEGVTANLFKEGLSLAMIQAVFKYMGIT